MASARDAAQLGQQDHALQLVGVRAGQHGDDGLVALGLIGTCGALGDM